MKSVWSLHFATLEVRDQPAPYEVATSIERLLAAIGYADRNGMNTPRPNSEHIDQIHGIVVTGL